MTTLRSETLSARIEKFFVDNPGESLLIEDICIKFDITRKSAKAAVLCIERRRGALRQVCGLVMGLQA